MAEQKMANPLGDSSYDVGDQSHKIYSGVCQQIFYNTWDFYNMKSWDSYGRDLTKKAPAIVTETTTANKFYYKTCQPSWVLGK